jgi:precorrin-6x reductase
VRVLPVPDSVRKVLDLGIPVSHVVAMQGPSSCALNEALLREFDIATMVTKASGAEGGFGQKVEAALSCGVEAVVVGRPPGAAGMSLEQVKRELEERYGA